MAMHDRRQSDRRPNSIVRELPSHPNGIELDDPAPVETTGERGDNSQLAQLDRNLLEHLFNALEMYQSRA
jgi:hypothetical protein